jgi:carbonic anhydrase
MRDNPLEKTVMKLKITALVVALAGTFAFTAEEHHADHHPHWGYSGEAAPDKWGALEPSFASCASGKVQSPVDVPSSKAGSAHPAAIAWHPGAKDIVNNGHTIQVDYRPGSTLKVDGRPYELKQFHFHAPSENHIDGQAFPLEAHFVHADAEGKLAVVAVMFSEGAASAPLEALWKAIPAHEGEKKSLPASFDASTLLPRDRSHYRFAGSLTTPPCSEGVTWLVMREPVTASAAQVAAFTRAVGFANNRPVQPLNGRKVVLE